MRSMVSDVPSVWSRNIRNLKRVSVLSSQIAKLLGGDADQINMKEVKKVIGQLDRKKRMCEVILRVHNIPP